VPALAFQCLSRLPHVTAQEPDDARGIAQRLRGAATGGCGALDLRRNIQMNCWVRSHPRRDGAAHDLRSRRHGLCGSPPSTGSEQREQGQQPASTAQPPQTLADVGTSHDHGVPEKDGAPTCELRKSCRL
jgi:hypothetical protein